MFWRAFAAQVRAIGAIMMRELVTRWGRRNLGFAWLIAEPLVFAIPVLLVWSVVRAPYERGLPLVAFLWTGYMPLLLFRHVTAISINTVKANSALLYHRLITPFDIYFGRCGLEVLGNFASIVVAFIVFYLTGFLEMPENFPLFIIGFLYMAWWSLAVALILAALTERSEVVAQVWAPIAYLYIAFCGFFFLAEWLPIGLRRIALLIDPPLHAYEMVRGGYFGSKIIPYYDMGYLTYLLSVMTFIGLWLFRQVRHHIDMSS